MMKSNLCKKCHSAVFLPAVIITILCTDAFYALASGKSSVPHSIIAALPSSSLSAGGVGFTLSTEKTRDLFGNRGFTLSTMVNGTKKSLFLPSIVEHPKTLVSINSSRAILIGDASGVTQAFTLFNPLTGEIKLQVPCEFPALSPDNSKIAFVRFFPPHFAPLYTSSAIYAVYRLADSGLNDDSTIHDDVGTRVYPAEDVPRDVSTERGVHRLEGSIDWVSDTSFTFVDSFEGYASRIRVTVGKNTVNAMVVNRVQDSENR